MVTELLVGLEFDEGEMAFSQRGDHENPEFSQKLKVTST